MDYQKLFEIIDELNGEYTGLWEDCCNIDSPSHYKEGIDRVSALFIDRARERGWQVEILPLEKAGDAVCITLNPKSQEAPVALSGHLDTVHPVGAFGSPAVKMDGEKIYGPGVVDCKGGAVAALMAMDALDQMGFRDRPVQLLLQTDEEVHSMLSGRKTIDWICEKAKNAVAFLNAEPSAPGTLILQRKGVMGVDITVRGKAAHAGRCYQGCSAIAAAARLIAEIERYKDPEGITCNVGLIQGGTARNTVPEECTFRVDIRYTCEKERLRILEEIKKIASRTEEGCTAQVQDHGWRAAMEPCERNAELLKKINAVFMQCGLPRAEAEKSNGGSDAADVTVYGIPCVDCFGVEGGGIHTLGEYGILASLAASAKKMAALACGL